MTGRTAVAITALVSLVALCAVMTALGQTAAAVLALIPSIALGVQQILQAYTQHVEGRRTTVGPGDAEERQQ
ncbi:hypothetical protein GCM10010277_75780 [Streptomyces longisporoflavus]|uniref:hypothetical protein n=1 Tax=Streptomyces longisporoflavus TaxID=28044 RepID=UPI00167EE6D5|nr:hypothetical protein [Streptomyces longisporoflavus]GGV67276.1 hypothetical protein GCM10010277_75780 [Streptomyces longisporoflavus]